VKAFNLPRVLMQRRVHVVIAVNERMIALTRNSAKDKRHATIVTVTPDSSSRYPFGLCNDKAEMKVGSIRSHRKYRTGCKNCKRRKIRVSFITLQAFNF
jgi:hypothetical protein